MTNPERDAYIERLSKGGVSPQRRASLRSLDEFDAMMDGFLRAGASKHTIELERSLIHAFMLTLADMEEADASPGDVMRFCESALSALLATMAGTLSSQSALPYERFAEMFFGRAMDRAMCLVAKGPDVRVRVGR